MVALSLLFSLIADAAAVVAPGDPSTASRPRPCPVH